MFFYRQPEAGIAVLMYSIFKDVGLRLWNFVSSPVDKVQSERQSGLLKSCYEATEENLRM